MEIYNVHLLRQDPVETLRAYNGRDFKKVKLYLSNGLDRFVGEAYDSLAEKLAEEPLDYQCAYNVQIELEIRERKDEATGDVRKFNTIKINKICVG